jgi:hypothetical protein
MAACAQMGLDTKGWPIGHVDASAAWWFRSSKPNILEISPFLSISWVEENT